MNRVPSGLIGNESSHPPLKRKQSVDNISTDQNDDGLARPSVTKKPKYIVWTSSEHWQAILRYLPLTSLMQFAKTSKENRKIAFSVLKEPDYFAKEILTINPNIFAFVLKSLLRQANPSNAELLQMGKACPASLELKVLKRKSLVTLPQLTVNFNDNVEILEPFNVHTIIFDRFFGVNQEIANNGHLTNDELDFLLSELPDLEDSLLLKHPPGYVVSNLKHYVNSATPETFSKLIGFFLKRNPGQIQQVWKEVVNTTSQDRQKILFETLIHHPLLDSYKSSFTDKNNNVTSVIKLKRLIYGPLGLLKGEGSLKDKKGNDFVGEFNKGVPVKGEGSLKFIGYFDSYKGSIKEGKPFEGKGDYRDLNGNLFQGTFKQDEFGRVFNGDIKKGKREGNQKIIFSDGDIYSGQFKNGKPITPGTYQFVDKSTYSGILKDFRPNGNGTRTYPDGDIDTGIFTDGQLNGQGIRKCSNGDVYEGEIKDENFNGKGILKYANGDVYEGEFKDGRLNGKGISTLPNGDVYEGEFKDYRRNGKGILKYANGDVYEGEFKDGRLNGQGIMKFANHNVYEGEFKDGRINGQGIFKYLKGDVYEGGFKDSRFNGKAILKCADGKVYEGEFKDSRFNGKGILKFVDGKVYEGEFKDGRFNGKGIMKFAKGEEYEGEFKDGHYSGKAILKCANGNVYEGEFKDSKRNGQGILKYATGAVYKGEFKDDKQNGQGILKYASARYEGAFVDDTLSGKGILTMVNGNVYEGDFLGNRYNGSGIIKYADGGIFEGEFKDGNPNGLGVSIDSKKFRCTGTYIEGKREGVFQVLNPEGESYTIEFRANLPWNGKFKMDLPDGSYKLTTFKDGIKTSEE